MSTPRSVDDLIRGIASGVALLARSPQGRRQRYELRISDGVPVSAVVVYSSVGNGTIVVTTTRTDREPGVLATDLRSMLVQGLLASRINEAGVDFDVARRLVQRPPSMGVIHVDGRSMPASVIGDHDLVAYGVEFDELQVVIAGPKADLSGDISVRMMTGADE